MSDTHAPFFKMNGLGNKIIVADMRNHDQNGPNVTPAAAIALAASDETHFDQLMAVYTPRQANRDATIEIFNSDGSMAEACGNGTRCVVQWLNKDTGKNEFVFQTAGGRLDARLQPDGMITVNMGMPRFDWEQIPLSEEFADTRNIELQVGPIDDPIVHTPSVANIGNPHAIFWVDRDPDEFELDKFGPLLENHPIFPERANISLAQVVAPDTLKIRTWERGAGLTLACGSGACAAAVCAARTGRTGRKVNVNVPGGLLIIDWQDNNSILMTGAAEHEFEGRFNPISGEWSRS